MSLVHLPGYPAVPGAWEALTYCCVLSLSPPTPTGSLLITGADHQPLLTRSTATLLPERNQALAGSRVGVTVTPMRSVSSFPHHTPPFLTCRKLPRMAEPSGVSLVSSLLY